MSLIDIEQNIRNVQRSNEEVDSLVGQLMGILDIMVPPENTKDSAVSGGANRLARVRNEIIHIGTQNERQIVWLQLIIELLDGPQPQAPFEVPQGISGTLRGARQDSMGVAARVGDYLEEDRRR